jgi:hypothetical protein
MRILSLQDLLLYVINFLSLNNNYKFKMIEYEIRNKH